MKSALSIVALLGFSCGLFGQKAKTAMSVLAPAAKNYSDFVKPLKFRSIGPFRGGRSVTACGVPGQPAVYYMGTTGGGVWKTEDAGTSWHNISDGFFTTGSVGSVAVAASDVNVVYVGMGEHAPRGVMTSHGDGVYKSTDAGKTWKHIGLRETKHISWIRIHPNNPDVVWVAAQGALYGATAERGVYKTTDGGQNWKKVLYIDENTGCADLDVDVHNPRILYAAMWNHWRKPWEIKSGGKGSGLFKSVDGGETWSPVTNGIPAKLGKMSVSISRANPSRVFALIESDTQEELGGLFVSNNGGESFSRISKDHRLTQRAWYYVEVFADPVEENTVYVLNSPGLKSTDGGKTWTNIRGTHGDYHQLWINPANNKNMVVANDGGAAVTFNAGKTWSSQSNQPTAQFYRISVDNLFPYHIYAGQQDNTSVKVLSRSLSGYSLGEKDWWYSAGGESAFLAFDPNNPTVVAGGSYQGTIEWLDTESREGKNMMIAPIQYQALQPKQMKYRFNWNAPIIHSLHEKGAFYHAANKVFKTTDRGKTWAVVSPDLTRNDTLKQGMSGWPYTNEGAGGENYGTIAYLTESPHEAGLMFAGSDDGLVHITRDGGKTWQNITPPGLQESLINCIEVSPHDKATVYIATTRYKFNDHTPGLYKSTDYGKTWVNINNGIAAHAFTRCIREDNVLKGLLFAGTEIGLYLSADGGASWQQQQMGLPITPVTDLKVHGGNLIAATMGRSFWVLDDLVQLRQLAAWTEAGKMTLYQPADAYRLSGGSMLDGDMEPQGTVASTFAGVNAPAGVVFYYQLPNDNDTATLYLDIKNSDGEIVRSYSSNANPQFESYPGGPGDDPLLAGSAGMHRFVWDQRYPTLIGVPRVFIEGSYAGGRAAPGRYTATLRRGTQQQQVSFTIKPHPGLLYPAADYAEQQQWQRKIENDFNQIHQTVLDGRKIRQQLELFAQMATANPTAQALGKEAKALAAKLQAWEDEVVQNKAESNDDIINYVNKISADFIFLKGELDTNIPYVTNGVKEQYAALKAQWQGHWAVYNRLVTEELNTFNQKCTQQQIQQIMLPQ